MNKQLDLDMKEIKVKEIQKKWRNKVSKEFMQYGILACGVSA